MNRSIVLVILIMIVVFTTLIALVGGGIAHSSLYNKIWLANGNEPPECMTPNDNTFTCPHTDAEYYHGFYWSSHITQFSILIAGIVFGVKLCSKKTDKIPKKSLINSIFDSHAQKPSTKFNLFLEAGIDCPFLGVRTYWSTDNQRQIG